MLNPRPLLFATCGVATLAASLFMASGCKPKPEAHSHESHQAAPADGPAAFTAKLTEISGVQGLYSIRHPKLILAELETMIAAVPETAMVRFFLGGLAPYGYPEFTEIAAGSNIGIAMLELTPEELAAQKPTVVGFAKIKENGKIWTALTGAGLALKKDGEWTWIAQNPDSFAKVTAPAAVYAHLDQPQDEEIRAWGRLSPALLNNLKGPAFEKLKASLESLAEEDRKAVIAYADVLWGYLAQLHSAGGSLDLNNDGISLSYFGQFLPDTSFGRYFRYPPGPAPKIAASVPADGLINAVVRQNMTGQVELVNDLLASLEAVDYPAGAEMIKSAKAGILALLKGSDGSGVATMNFKLSKEGRPPVASVFTVNSGNYSEADVLSGYKTTFELTKRFSNTIIASTASLVPGAPAPVVSMELKENALEIDGVRFGAIVTNTTVKAREDGEEDLVEKNTQYFGVAGGTLVSGSDEAELRAKLPAVIGKKAVSNPISLPFAADELMVAVISGENIVDTTLAGIQLDTTDADVRAQIDGLKQGFAAAGPVKLAMAGSQAKVAVKLSIPYKFISQGMRFGQFVSAQTVVDVDEAPTGEHVIMPEGEL